MNILEPLGALFSILGAWKMGKGFQCNINARNTFTLFLIANVFLLNMAIHEMLIPLIVQIMFFTYFSVKGLKSFSPKTIPYVFGALLVVAIPTVYNLVISLDTVATTTITNLEVLASFTAIFGNIFLAKKKASVRVFAFYNFLIADAIYIFIGLDNGLYFFALQAGYFLITSVMAIKSTIKEINASDRV